MRAGPIFAATGLVTAVVLYVQHGVADVLALLADAGWGLALAALLHVVPMSLNARAWQILFTEPRPGLGLVMLAVWIRESVNGLLPVARIGGEIASYRMLSARSIHRIAIVVSLIVDMTVSILTQAAVSALAVAFLLAAGVGVALMQEIAVGLIVLTLLGIVFLCAQRGRAFQMIARKVDTLIAGRFKGVIDYTSRIDEALSAIYRRSRALLICATWQSLAWVAGALEIWVALYFLGRPVDALTAVIIELAVQAVSSVAFIVPAALGVQEGAFVLVGHALGVDAGTALALAAARRVRDLVVFFPGLLFWHWQEVRGRSPATVRR